MTRTMTDPATPDEPLRAKTALILRIGSIALLAFALGMSALSLMTVVGSAWPGVLPAIMVGMIGAAIAPTLLLIFSGGVARGGGGATGLSLVLTYLIAARALGTMLIALTRLQYIPFTEAFLPGLIVFAIAVWMAVTTTRLWLRERTIWPDVARIHYARLAWRRARVAMTIVWSLVLVLGLLFAGLGTLFYFEDPRGMAGGIGIIFVIFSAVPLAVATWTFILWLRLRRRGPIVARSTAWQIASMLFLWTLLTSATQGTNFSVAGRGASSIVALIPTGVLVWMLTELLHASLARNATGGRSFGGFDVVALDEQIPIADIARPPPPSVPESPSAQREV